MSERDGPFHPLLAGAAAGAAWADLLLGLNPHLLSPGRGLVLAGLGTAAGAVLASPWLLPGRREGRPGRAGAVVFGLAAGLLALFAEAQRLIHLAFVQGHARRVLGGTAVVAGVWAAAALANALRSRARRTSAAPYPALFLGLFLLVPVLCGRSRPAAAPATPPAIAAAPTRSLLVIGLDGVSWELLTAGASEGALPTFAELLKKGAAGPLEPLGAFERPALWTTAATGKRPFKHGVVSGEEWDTPAGALFLRPLVPGSTLRIGLPFVRPRPATAPSRSLAFWEILGRRGHETAALGWPAAARTGTEDRLETFQVEPGRLDRPLVQSLSPEGLAPALARRTTLAGAARDLSVAGAAMATVPQGPVNVLVLVLSGAREVARPFGAAGDPHYFGLPLPDAGARSRALTAYYAFLDDLLRQLLERGGRDRTICIFTPASFGPPPPLDAVASFLRAEPPEAGPEAGSDGFILLHGAGIREGVRLTSAHVLDLAPTLLVLAGEPFALDIDGRVLAEAFDERFAGRTSIPIVTTFEPGGPQ
ncbi:MAG TPA: alkaline phosphatase family protein [Thermoanaerobaculia bacterium]|nr:alkaline phosphatase family protein [Thermoanaerobaculia bacterium]